MTLVAGQNLSELFPTRVEAEFESLALDRVRTLSFLPSTLSVVRKFQELRKDPDADSKAYLRVIGLDSALTSKMISLANSPWFGIRNRVTRPEVAFNLLGMNTVNALILSYSLNLLHNQLRLTVAESRQLWLACLFKAVVAKHYVSTFDKSLAEEAFVCGMLQDISLPVMYSVARERMSDLLEDSSIDWRYRMWKERQMFGLDHAELGRMVAQKFGLPELFVDAIGFHHDLPRLQALLKSSVLAGGIYLAGFFPHAWGHWNTSDANSARTFSSELLASTAHDDSAFLSGAYTEFQNHCNCFESEPDEGRTFLAPFLSVLV